jgi:predicted nucleotidyltransferase
VFGSVARGDDRPDSDLDLLADMPPGIGLIGLGRLEAELEDIMGARVDLAPADSLKPHVRMHVRAGSGAAAIVIANASPMCWRPSRRFARTWGGEAYPMAW